MVFLGDKSLAASRGPTESDLDPASAIPELDLRPQDNLVVSSQDTANWVLSYSAVLPLVPPATATWARDADEAVGHRQDGDWHVYRANLLLRIGLAAEADAALQDALAKSPDHPQALALASVIASIQGRKDDALELATRATRIDPASSAAWLALSYTQQTRGDLDNALASVRQAQLAEARNGTGWVREAELHLALGQLKAARAAADHALTLQPDSSIAHGTRALVALLQKDWNAARSGFERATQLNPIDANARFGLSLAHIQHGDLQKAQDELQAAVERAPNNGLFHTYLGRVFLASGDVEKARNEFELVKKIDPNNPSVWLFSGQMHLQANRPSSALEDIRASIQRNDGRKVYRGRDLLADDQTLNQIDLSIALQALGFSDLALHAAQDAAESGATNSAAYRNLADVYAQITRGTQARRSLALQSLFDAPLGQLPMSLDVVQGVGGSTPPPNHNLPSVQESRQSGLNEYSALFAPSGWQLAVDGNTASYDTWGEQVRLGGSDKSRLGFGFSRISQRSDGLDGKRLDNDAWQGILQARLSAETSAFMEYRHAVSLRDETLFPYRLVGEIPLAADDMVNVARLGLNWRFGGNANLKLLLSRQWRDQNIDYTNFGISALASGTADMPELQFQWNSDRFNLTLGASRFAEQGKIAYSYYPPGVVDSIDLSTPLLYGYGTWHLDKTLSVTLGISHLDFSQDSDSIVFTRTMPKFGLNWHPMSGSHFRFASLEAAALPKTGGAGLEPIEVAGVRQWFGDEIGSVHRIVSANWEQTLTPSLDLILEASRNRLLIPGVDPNVGGTLLDPQSERQAKAGLYWRPSPSLLAGWEGGLRLTYEYLDQDRPNVAQDNNGVSRQIARHWTLGGQISGPRSMGVDIVLTRVGSRQTFFVADGPPTFSSFREHFWMTDAALTWKLDKGRKQFSVGVRNIADQDVGHYQEVDTLLPRFAQNRFVYGRLQLQFY